MLGEASAWLGSASVGVIESPGCPIHHMYPPAGSATLRADTWTVHGHPSASIPETTVRGFARSRRGSGWRARRDQLR